MSETRDASISPKQVTSGRQGKPDLVVQRADWMRKRWRVVRSARERLTVTCV